MKIFYYAHPVETYWTYIEDIVEELAKKKFGEIFCIKDWPSLREAVNEDARKKLADLFVTMRKFVMRYEKGKIPETDAKNIAYDFMDTLKHNSTLGTILLNPSTFKDPILIMARSEMFKRKAYPHFCYGLIDQCNSVIAHGYVIDSYIKQIFTAWLKISISSPELLGYCRSLIKLIREAEDMLWSPGACDEVKYALKNGKEVFCLCNSVLKKVSVKDLNAFDLSKVPFDKHGLMLYNKIWQPIAENVYRTLTSLNYPKFFT